MAGVRRLSSIDVKGKLRGFDKSSHAKSLAEGLMRQCDDDKSLAERINKANAVVAAVREGGVSSFFAAEYAKVFSEPGKALATRERLIAEFEADHGLTKRRAAKMADCIVFSAAKKPELDPIERLSKMCSNALGAGVSYDIVADSVYYNKPDVELKTFTKKCIMFSSRKNKPLSVPEDKLLDIISGAVPPLITAAIRKEKQRKAVQDVCDALNDFENQD